jgi:hypothetical protein
MPSEFVESFNETSVNVVEIMNEIRNFRNDNDERIFSDECISQMLDISCSPLYCSADEKQLLIKYDQDDCHRTIMEW